MLRVGSAEEVTSQEDPSGGRISPLLNTFRWPSGMTLTPLSAPDRTRARYLLQPALGPLAQECETGAQRQQPKVGTTRAGQPHRQNKITEEHRGPPAEGRKMGGDTRENQKWENQEQLTTYSVPPGHTPSIIPLKHNFILSV